MYSLLTLVLPTVSENAEPLLEVSSDPTVGPAVIKKEILGGTKVAREDMN